MNRQIILAGLVLSAMGIGEAVAVCPGTQVVNGGAAVTEIDRVTFSNLGNGQSVTVGGLQLTAPNAGKYNTGRKVAVAYAGKLNGVAPGGDFGATSLSGWNAAANAAGAKLRFIATVPGPGQISVSASGGAAAPTVEQIRAGRVGGGNHLLQLLRNKTVCIGTPGNWQSQEFHKMPSGAANSLIDWKKGPTDPVDPTSPIGSWYVSGVGETTRVNYNYGDASYNYTVFDQGGGNYLFCEQNGNPGFTPIPATLRNGQTGC